MAEIEARYEEHQRKVEARVQQILSGTEDKPESDPDPEGFVPNKPGLGFRYKETEEGIVGERPMVRLAKGFTPEARADFVRRMKEQGITTMTPEGIAEGRSGPGIVRRG